MTSAEKHQSENDRSQKSAQEIYDDMPKGADSHTQREAFEREMAERGRSDEAGEVGEALD